MIDSWGSNGALSFPIDCDAVLKHLKQDMRDDWFPDVLQYVDLFASKNNFKEIIIALIEDGNGQYPPAVRYLRDIPKKGFGIRYGLETDFYDRFIYQAICSFLMSFYDPLLSNRVLGHRYNNQRSDNRYLFKNRIDLWRTFEGITHTAIHSGQALLATDLINYYENISIDQINSAFLEKLPRLDATGKEKVAIRNAIQTLSALLETWSFSNRHGLPQNRDASSFIANVVLCDVDKKMVELGHDYYRYVDDIRIICPDATKARKSLMDLIGQLRLLGLNINSAKTDILTNKTKTETIAQFFPAMDERSVAIDTMWRSRSRKVVSRSIGPIFEMVGDLIKSRETQSRQFRFAVNRLGMIMEANIFNVGPALAKGLLDLIFEELEAQAVSTDQFCRLLSVLELAEEHLQKIEGYLGDSTRAIHGWQNYHLWILLAKKSWRSEVLIAVAKKKISDDVYAPEVAAIFVYLQAVGEEQSILLPKIEEFNEEWPYQHRRYFLLALKDASPEQLKPLISKLGHRLVGTIKRAHSHILDGSIARSQEPAELFDLYDRISPYD